MSSEQNITPVRRMHRVWWRRMVRRWPVLVWLILAVVAVWLYNHGGEYMRINGMVEVVTESVGPLEDGYLKQVLVRPGEEVQAGQVVAELDTVLIDQEIAALKESLMSRQAEDIRQFRGASQRLEEELRQLRLDEAEDRTELEVYQEELSQMEALVADGFATREDFVEIRARVAVLRQRLDYYPQFEREVRRDLAELEHLRETVLPPEGRDLNQSGRLQVMNQRRAAHFLKAGNAGIVSEIRRQPGEVVETGQTVVQIITRQPARILAFMNESDTRPIAVGDVVEMEPAIGGERIEARIVSISPNVQALADRASPIPNRVVRGRRLELVPVEDFDLPPGSSVVVYLPRKEMLWNSLFGGWKP
mgnify:CR=1 FL=1